MYFKRLKGNFLREHLHNMAIKTQGSYSAEGALLSDSRTAITQKFPAKLYCIENCLQFSQDTLSVNKTGSNISGPRVISGFRCGVNELSAPLRRYAA
jgi:hypothetical protein